MAQKKNDWEINNLSIQNFKSIKEIGLNPSRVNVFIGKPNAGKSNLLESLVFLGTELKGGGERSLSKRDIRYTDVSSLFYDQNYDEPIVVYNNKYTCELKKGGNSFSYDFAKDGAPYSYTINAEGQITGGSNIQRDINISKYHFKEIPDRQSSSILTHLNPDGSNLWDVTRHNSKLKEFAKDFFKEYSLDVLFDKQNNKFDIMRRNEDSYYLIDFSMTPDTFQRMLYYLAAIESNKNAILLLEEPEAQSYPPYIQMLAERIVDDMDNQYFITTHSPFIVEKMLERAGTSDDVKIFVTYFEEYQTKVHELTKGEIDQILDYNVDLFFNMESYQKMIEQPHILPECHADTLLVNMLIKSTVAHQPNINEVFKTLKLFAIKKRKAIGIIDDDKNKDKFEYYREFKLMEANDNYKYLKHTNGIHYLIVTKGKGFEKFIIGCADEAGVTHKLLKDFDRLKYICKSPAVHTDTDFKNLLNTLIQRKSPTLMAMRKILLKHITV